MGAGRTTRVRPALSGLSRRRLLFANRLVLISTAPLAWTAGQSAVIAATNSLHHAATAESLKYPVIEPALIRLS